MPVTDGIGILTEMHLHTEGHLHLTKKNNETSVHYQREPSPVTPFLCRLGSGRNSLQAVPSQRHGLHDLLRLPHAGFRLFHLRPLPASKRGSLVHGCVDGLSHTEPSPRDKVFSLAFNGTTYPIDNLEGIPVNTFQATLDGLTPQRSRSSCAACARTATPTRHSWK